MNRLKLLKTYPFGLFLCLEWFLLGAAIFDEFLPVLFFRRMNQDSSLLLIFSSLGLIGLGAIGIRFPRGNDFNKWTYTFCQFGLLWLPFLSNYFPFVPHLIIIMRSRLIFERNRCFLVTVLTIIFHFSLCILYYPSFQLHVQNGGDLNLEQFKMLKITNSIAILAISCFYSAIIFTLVDVLLREYRGRQELALAHQKLNKYAILVEDKAIVCERNRIAREIHDSVGHELTAQAIQLNNAIAFWQSEPAKAHWFLLEARKLVKNTLQDLRHSVSTLDADPLQGKSLEKALNLLVEDFSQHTQIPVQYTPVLARALSKEVEMAAYRIMQEALTNIAKHSNSTEVIVDIQTLPEHLELTVKDNGQGFNPEQNTTGFGLQGIRERVAALGGMVEISSQPGSGCIIFTKLFYP